MKKAGGPKVIALPPQIYAGFIVTAFILEYMRPTVSFHPAVRIYGGFLFLAAGVVLMTLAVRAFLFAKTPIEPYLPTETIVSQGIYKRVRNPMYVALTLIYLGIALSLSNLWMFIFLLPLLVIIHFGVILREEVYLEDKFGETYRTYKHDSRRWM